MQKKLTKNNSMNAVGVLRHNRHTAIGTAAV